MKVVARIAGVPRSTRRLVAAWLIVEITIWAFAWAIGRAGLSFPKSPVEVLSNWDGTHYLTIARDGYSTEGAELRGFNFFPLLPAISRFLGGPEHAALAGIVLNQFCILAAILLIGRLRQRSRPPRFPVSQGSGYCNAAGLFFLGLLSKSLFLLFSLILVIAYRHNAIVVGMPGRRAGRSHPPGGSLPARALSPRHDRSSAARRAFDETLPALLPPSQVLAFMWLTSAGVSVIPWPMCICKRFGGKRLDAAL